MPTTNADILIVATQRRWIADDLAPHSPIPVHHDHALDAPLIPHHLTAAWWTTTHHATRLLHAGLTIPFTSPGPHWLDHLPLELTRRRIWTGPLTDIRNNNAPTAGWTKPAEAKNPNFPAAWYTREQLLHTTRDLPDDHLIQISPTRLTITEEHRYFIHDGHIAAHSPYLDPHGNTWDPTWHDRTDLHTNDATAFVHDALTRINGPRAWVLDVAHTTTGWAIIEANPAWSSSPYGAHPRPVAHAVITATTGNPHGWTWTPDPWLQHTAQRQRPLTPTHPTWLTTRSEQLA